MDVFERGAAVFIDARFDVEVDRMIDIDEKDSKRHDAELLVVHAFLHTGRIFEKVVIDIRQHQTAEDRSDQEQEEVGRILEYECPGEQLLVENPRHRFENDRTGGRCHDRLQHLLPEALHLGLRPHDHIQDSQNDKGK